MVLSIGMRMSMTLQQWLEGSGNQGRAWWQLSQQVHLLGHLACLERELGARPLLPEQLLEAHLQQGFSHMQASATCIFLHMHLSRSGNCQPYAQSNSRLLRTHRSVAPADCTCPQPPHARQWHGSDTGGCRDGCAPPAFAMDSGLIWGTADVAMTRASAPSSECSSAPLPFRMSPQCSALEGTPSASSRFADCMHACGSMQAQRAGTVPSAVMVYMHGACLPWALKDACMHARREYVCCTRWLGMMV